MKDLVDTVEMYLKTVFELNEEGVPPLRARIVERLGQSGPTVSETVSRLERDDLVTLPSRRIEFTSRGRVRATEVMRRHRIAECLLLNVLNVPLEKVHSEACRWEHALSDEVANQMAAFLDNPVLDPFGNPIPPADVEHYVPQSSLDEGLIPLSKVECADGETKVVRVERLTEVLQRDETQIALFAGVGLLPGSSVTVRNFVDNDVYIDVAGGTKLALPLTVASKIFVSL